jgi:hypothetical protein
MRGRGTGQGANVLPIQSRAASTIGRTTPKKWSVFGTVVTVVVAHPATTSAMISGGEKWSYSGTASAFGRGVAPDSGGGQHGGGRCQQVPTPDPFVVDTRRDAGPEGVAGQDDRKLRPLLGRGIDGGHDLLSNRGRFGRGEIQANGTDCDLGQAAEQAVDEGVESIAPEVRMWVEEDGYAQGFVGGVHISSHAEVWPTWGSRRQES